MRLVIICALLAACTSGAARTTAALQAEVADLRARVNSLEAQVRALSTGGDVGGDPAREQAAVEIAIQARAAMDSMNMDLARELVDRLVQEYPDTQIGQAAVEVAERLALIGAPAPPLTVERWFRGKGKIDADRTTLLVFFEPWCPHCRREAPSLQERHQALADEAVRNMFASREQAVQGLGLANQAGAVIVEIQDAAKQVVSAVERFAKEL